MSRPPKSASPRVAPVHVKVVRLPHAEGLALPAYQTAQSAGLDLMAAVAASKPVTIPPGGRALLPTGLAIALPAGTEAQVRPRSGLALKHGVTLLNTPGTIDADYRGEVQVILINHGDAPFVVRRGERIAQMVIAEVRQVRLVEVAALDETARGIGGFGSTGVAASDVDAKKSKRLPPKARSRKEPAGKAAKTASRNSKIRT